MPLVVPDLGVERAVLVLLGDARQHAAAIALAASATSKRLLIILDESARPQSWDGLQATLSFVYGAATQIAFAMEKPLMDVDVVLEPRVPADVRWDRVFRGAGSSIPPALDGVEVLDVPPSEHAPPVEPLSDSEPIRTYPVVALGGTFDHLHAGHKILLTMSAALASRKLIVGVTDDVLLVRKKNRHVLEPLGLRIARTRGFLELIKPGLELDIVPIQDVYGPTGWEADIQALVVSRETLPGAASIAKLREEKDLPKLDVFIINVVSHDAARVLGESLDAETLVKSKMSSTAIRQWIVDHQSDA
ncbi:Nucleotidylyl transferase [Auricularia subglabra TFB-10046 SS5]|nr:Nucleotidylyl transferase [Auricularia subglabra TFB-10046 SS5]